MKTLVKLFEPGQIGNMELSNRVVLAPMGSMGHVSEPGGYVTNELLEFYGARARGGVGFIQLSNRVTSSMALMPPEHLMGSYQGPLYNAGLLSLEDDQHIPSARRFTDAMHAHGTKVGFSVSHFGIMLARALRSRPPESRPDLVRVVAPSAVRDPFSGRVPEPMTEDEIRENIEELAMAAKRGIAAGFDAIRIQGGHGYLVHQFLSPRTNKRTDRYGGSLENRARYPCELVRRFREVVGPEYPIIFRMNGADFLEGGITQQEALQQALLFIDAGTSAIDVSAAPMETRFHGIPTMYQPSGTIVHLAAAMKKMVDVPIIITGKIDALLGEHILEEGYADFIQMGRALIADPELVTKARQGKLDEIRPCIYCNNCLDRLQSPSLNHACAVNCEVGQELEFRLEPAPHPKKVVVIGGGPGGMEAASTLARRGHDTSLYEKSHRVGGQWNYLSAFVPEVNNLVTYLSAEMKRSGVKVFLNQEATTRMIEDIDPDAVIVATGANPMIPSAVPGIDGNRVFTAGDILSGTADTGAEVLVVGGRTVGLVTALYLARKGKRVTVATRGKIGRGISHSKKHALMEALIKYNVFLYPNCTLDSITPNGVNLIWDSSDPAVKYGEKYELIFLRAASVVLALGSKSENRLAQELAGLRNHVYSIGDCVTPRDIFCAIHEGSELGRMI